MESYKAAYINEIEKMLKRKKAIVVLIISLVVIVLGELIVLGGKSGFKIQIANMYQFPRMVLSGFVNTILPLFTTLVAIDVFAGEFSQNTMKISLTRPVTRLKLFSAKVTAIASFVLANLLIVMVLSLITGLIFNSGSTSISIIEILKVVVSYLVTLVPILTFALMIVFFSNIFRSGAAVFFLAIVLFIAFYVLSFVYSTYSSLFVTSYLGWFNKWMIEPFPVMTIIRQFFIMAGCAIMFFTAGFYLFDKKDL
ncbi:MAG: ABC transporter permease [Clostridia bacterium]|nr:ABC transporter permease [Clostridia bacterium]